MTLDVQRILALQAEHVARAVREVLATPPQGDHRTPWRGSGALHDSIEAVSEGNKAVVGSTSPAALAQEFGTEHMPPRPFLAPTAAAHADDVVQAVAAEAVAQIRDALERR